MEELKAFANLFRVYINDTATEGERRKFLSLSQKPAFLPELQRLIDEEMKIGQSSIRLTDIEKDQILEVIFQSSPAEKSKPLGWLRSMAVASIFLMIAFGTLLIIKEPDGLLKSARNTAQDIAPGGNKAMLTLDNGEQILLTGAGTGNLAIQDNIQISKTANGQIEYHAGRSGISNSTKLTYNTVKTPNGGQYHLKLTDGTGVWLNAASSIKYPVAFLGNERKVEITGEVYFEVKHDAKKPFRVVSNQQMLEVLGTHFNVNAYPEEHQTKTTLLEGSVRINARGNRAILKIGQQSSVSENKISISDVDDTVSWKDGYFEFSETGIQEVMRQLSRWYDADIVYSGQVSQETFTARISRNKNISQVLKIINASKSIHVEIQGRRITVKN